MRFKEKRFELPLKIHVTDYEIGGTFLDEIRFSLNLSGAVDGFLDMAVDEHGQWELVKGSDTNLPIQANMPLIKLMAKQYGDFVESEFERLKKDSQQERLVRSLEEHKNALGRLQQASAEIANLERDQAVVQALSLKKVNDQSPNVRLAGMLLKLQKKLTGRKAYPGIVGDNKKFHLTLSRDGVVLHGTMHGMRIEVDLITKTGEVQPISEIPEVAEATLSLVKEAIEA